MNFWFIFIVHVMSTCTATKILYVLPDNVSDVNCPSQPCATLGQYLMDNGSLPVLSNVDYYFLPGEHRVVDGIDIGGAFNFSFIGFGNLSANLVCWSQSSVNVRFSYNVTIRNLVFDHCGGDLLYGHGIDVAVSLLLDMCEYCKVEDVYFFGYGFAGINLILNSSLNNITINMTIETPSSLVCGPKFFLMFWDVGYDWNKDFISIDQVTISGSNEMCYGYHEAMKIWLSDINGISIKLLNSQFYNMSQKALLILIKGTYASLVIKNCSFVHLKHEMKRMERIVYGSIVNSNLAVTFENCIFHYNVVITILRLHFGDNEHPHLCLSNITIKNCDFLNNIGNVLYLSNNEPGLTCKVDVFFNATTNIVRNEASFIMHLSHMTVTMNGTITLSENYMMESIMVLQYCNVTFTKTVTFLSNRCHYVINLISIHSPYITVMDHANITFTDISYHNHLLHLTNGPLENNYLGVYPYCIFQYNTLLKSNTYNTSELIKLYSISFNGNKPYGHVSNYSYDTQCTIFTIF